MKKILLGVLTISILVGVVLIGGHISARSKADEFLKLAREASSSSWEECKSYIAKTKDISHKLKYVPGEGSYIENPEDAKVVLELLRTYPTYPTSRLKAVNLFYDYRAELLKRFNGVEILAEFLNIEIDCSPTDFFVYLRALNIPKNKKFFSQKELLELKKPALEFISMKGSGSLLSLMVRIAALQEYVKFLGIEDAIILQKISVLKDGVKEDARTTNSNFISRSWKTRISELLFPLERAKAEIDTVRGREVELQDILRLITSKVS